MARRTPKPEAQVSTTLTPLRKTCDQCGKRLWVAHHCLSEEILLARPLLSSTQGDLTALLKEVKQLLTELEVPVKDAGKRSHHRLLPGGSSLLNRRCSFPFAAVWSPLVRSHHSGQRLDCPHPGKKDCHPL
jgi:hypothetical protein